MNVRFPRKSPMTTPADRTAPRRAVERPEHHMGTAEDATVQNRTHVGHALAAAVVAAVAVAGVLLAFIWPSIVTETTHVPVVVVGTQSQQQQVEGKADVADSGFTVTRRGTRAEAEEDLRQRRAYAAYVFAPNGDLEVLSATAASPSAAQITSRVTQSLGVDALTDYAEEKEKRASTAATDAAKSAGQQGAVKALEKVVAQMSASVPPGTPQLIALQSSLTAQQNTAKTAADTAAASKKALDGLHKPEVTYTDVAALSEDDPRGASLATLGMPLTMGGTIGGAAISLLLRGTRSRLLGVALYGTLGGLAVVLIMHSWFHVLQGNWALEWLASGLTLGATAALITGLQALFGRVGMSLGSIIGMFIGNPISSLQNPKEFLPEPWGAVGQLFVPGASGTLLRDLSYFPEADAAPAWTVLAAWVLLGVGLSLIADGLRRRRDRKAAALAA